MIQQIGPDGREEFVRRLGRTPFFSPVMAASSLLVTVSSSLSAEPV